MIMLAKTRILPGSVVYHESTRYQVIDLVSATHLVIKNHDGKTKTVKASDVTPDLVLPSEPLPDLSVIPQDKWERALEIYLAIQPLLVMGAGRTRADVKKVADEMDKHIATVYRWIDDYESSGLLSSLIRKTRKDMGSKRLDPQVEEIIKQVIEDLYLDSQRRTPTKVAKEARKRCKQSGLPEPDPQTVRTRILDISEEYRMRRRRGAKAAAEHFDHIQGSFPGAEYPLAVVQIDHTPMDVILVDDINRMPINRPFLTIATDVYSKMCVGYYLSLDHPGALATGLCISRAILGKESILASLGLDDMSWPCCGVMTRIHTDNAKEFRGNLLGLATKQYGIIAERRPKGRPHYGGHVERAFRTFMHEVHNELPGTTFSNVREKLEYDAEGRAVMTIDALEKWFTLFILGVYHQSPHAGNDGLPPIVKWERGVYGTDSEIGTGVPMRVSDEERLRLDFMPVIMATVQRYGIQIQGVHYWCDALRYFAGDHDPNAGKNRPKYICRYDPRNLSKIWMFDPKSEKYIEVPYRDLSRPPVSLWEIKESKRQLKKESMATTNEELIFKTIDRMRELVADEARKTKAARVKRQKQKQWNSASEGAAENTKKDFKPVTDKPENITNSEFFAPFEGIREAE
ncbi:Mu transposase C-terminal domain-containing protein [Methylomonas fluvii]|uniref:DDE-type integrase/transposase/recombinase n=1 Tax=Methylomonas fluvii TaxID=1854564 RepID=A0ABR9DA04_9GAMM|nr:Mu transposase C-terminal domain-containing protein [Methylomonas fluvii]MBD9359937.1 DDE-type integrase/transposase/recombinase [Methylomonas fluvii]